jgi:hypothetical protein
MICGEGNLAQLLLCIGSFTVLGDRKLSKPQCMFTRTTVFNHGRQSNTSPLKPVRLPSVNLSSNRHAVIASRDPASHFFQDRATTWRRLELREGNMFTGIGAIGKHNFISFLYLIYHMASSSDLSASSCELSVPIEALLVPLTWACRLGCS